jgi:TRAP transporter 4TM/12TM fusion protein
MSEKKFSPGTMRSLSGFPRALAYVCGASLTLVTFYTAFRGVFLPLVQRSIHLCLLLALTFLWFPADERSPRDRPSALDWLFTALSLAVLVWTLLNNHRYMTRIPYYSKVSALDMAAGTVLVLLVLESGRRTLGLFITILAGALIAYAFAGPLMPQMFAHQGVSFSRFIDIMYMTDMGLWNSLMGTSSTLLFIFIAFGAALQATHTDSHYMDISLALAGSKPGGPAKVAVISSAAMGTISGSTIANVVSTGTLTIPLMKKTGYSPEEAGAIETVASAGGQIMPPIMGTGAFILADFIGRRYFDIVQVSVLPAILFYATLWFFVDLKAKKKGLLGLPPDQLPSFRREMGRYWHMFLPILLLLGLLCFGFTPFLSGAACCVLILAFSFVRPETRLSLRGFFKALEDCSVSVAKIAGVIGCAAIIVSMINTTGLMLKSTAIILYLSRGSLLLTIAIEGLIAYVLGMGLPISTAYVILATLGAPALKELGIPLLAGHLMIFWFSQLSTITPPVCMTAFAAAGISGGHPMKTGFTALPLGSTFYAVPILFLFSNILNVMSRPVAACADFACALAGAYCFAVGVEGFCRRAPVESVMRALMLAATAMFFAATFTAVPDTVSAALAAAAGAILVFCCATHGRRR